MFILLSCFFFILLMTSAVFGFGWFYVGFAWIFRILFWFFLIGGIVSLVIALLNRGNTKTQV